MPTEIVLLPVCLFTVGLQMVYKIVSLGKIMAYNGKNCLWLRASSLHKYILKYTWHMDMVLVVVHLTSVYSTVSTFPRCARCTKFIVPSLMLIHLSFSHCPCLCTIQLTTELHTSSALTHKLQGEIPENSLLKRERYHPVLKRTWILDKNRLILNPRLDS